MTPERLKELGEGITPRPWEYRTDDEGCSMGWVGYRLDSGQAAWRNFEAICSIEGDSARQACNANLIAAAPDLLSACESLMAERDRLREALERIANPIAYLQKRADDMDCGLDGMMAVRLSNDANWLKEEARAALSGDGAGEGGA